MAECHALSIAFANRIDHRRYDEIAALFAEDDTLDRWGQLTNGRVAVIGGSKY